jgi:hypothetical protein
LTYNDFGEMRSKLERVKRNWPMIIENIMSTKFSALKISDSEDTEVGALDEGDLGDIFVDKPETEDWN